VSFDRSEVSKNKERVYLLLKFCFPVEFFDFRVWAYSELRIVKWRVNLSKYGAGVQDILLLFMFIITKDPAKKNYTKF
jgi:hypothetical protein